MSTKDFAASTGRHKYWELVEKELKLLQDECGMLKKELRRPVDCAVCRADHSETVFTKEGFTFVRCRKCGLVYVNPQCATEKLLESYEMNASLDYWVDVLLSQGEQEYDISKFTRACEELEELTPGRRVLDVGCSIALFLKIAKQRGWDTVGLELNRKAVKHAVEEYGLDVRPQLLDQADFSPESFDVVTLWEVLEHVSDPRDVIEQCSRVLKPGGVLAILVPNRDALSARVMRSHCSCFGGRNHLWYFDIRTLSALLDQTGFEVVRAETHLHQVQEILTYLNYKNPYYDERGGDDLDLPDGLLRKLEDFIMDNMLGYKLLAYARKVS